MTLSARNNFLRVSILIAALFFLFFSGLAVLIIIKNPEYLNTPFLLKLAMPELLPLISIISAIFIRRLFRKTSSIEIFFFIIYILSASFAAFRVGEQFLLIQNSPYYFGILITRTLYLAKTLGVLSLFMCSLFAAGIQYNKLGLILGVCGLISLTISTSLPINSFEFYSSLIYKVGNQNELFVVFMVIHLLSVINFFRASYIKHNKDYLILALCLVFLILGREILFYLKDPVNPVLLVSGLLLYLLSTTVFAYKTHSIYLWV